MWNIYNHFSLTTFIFCSFSIFFLAGKVVVVGGSRFGNDPNGGN